MEIIEIFLSKVSITALSVTMLLCVAANGISYIRMQSRLQMLADGYAECGFPFSLYGYGGFAPISEVLWAGLVADYLIAIFASVAVGIMWKKIKGNRVL